MYKNYHVDESKIFFVKICFQVKIILIAAETVNPMHSARIKARRIDKDTPL